MRESRAVVAIGFVAGIVLGGAATLLLRPTGAAMVAPSEHPAVHAAGETPPDPAAAPGKRDAGADGKLERIAAPGNDADELVSAALRTRAMAEIRRGWAESRKDAVPDEVMQRSLDSYCRTIIEAPAEMGRSAAKERSEKETRAAAVASGDAFAMLKQVGGDEPEVRELMRTPARFAELFRPQVGGATVDGRSIEGKKLDDGSVITFPAGVFAVSDFSTTRTPSPTDITVRGAGMDATLLVIAQGLSPRDGMARFAIEDCTVFAQSGITDVRGEPTVLALRRVRVVGFDCGTGSSVVFYTHMAAVLAQDCRFEGGYGRSPIHGCLINGQQPMLARFEGCVFARMALDYASEPTIVFANCSMTDLLRPLPRGPVYENCRSQVNELAQRSEWEALRASLTRDLNDLFPQWQQRLERR
jgi:hypothetical protein